MAQHFTDSDFQQEVLGADVLVMVDFYADWCGPCKMMSPNVEQLAEERKDAKIGKLDVDSNPQTAGNYGVHSIPTTIFFKGGKEIGRVVGFQSKESLQNKINELLKQ